jgi:hypothetical protein
MVIDRFLQALAAQGCRPTRSGSGWKAYCPAHDDRNPSLSISETPNGTVLVKCHAGCNAGQVVAALGLNLRDLFSLLRIPMLFRNRSQTAKRRRKNQDQVYAMARYALQDLEGRYGPAQASWVYRNAQGEPVGMVARWDQSQGKVIRPISRFPDGWRIAAMPEPRPLYRLPELLQADPQEPVFVLEGEKCAEAAAELGLVATTSSGGANAAAKSDWTPLRGRHVVILPDNDAAGRQYAHEVAQLCHRAGVASVKILDLAEYAAELPEGGDLVDILESHNWYGLGPLGDAAEPQDFVAWLHQAIQIREEWQPSDTETAPTNQGHQDPGPYRQKPKQADVLVKLALEHAELFHTPGGLDSEAYATMTVNDHRETWPLASKGFRLWLSRLYYQQTGRSPSAQAWQDALSVLNGIALWDRPEQAVFVRLAEHRGAIYLDLADSQWRTVEITASGWRIVDNPPVRFVRRRGMLALPVPLPGGTVDELRPLVNVSDDDGWRLLIGWLLATLRPNCPCPILIVNGEQDSAKTTLCHMLRALIDSNEADLCRPPRDNRDLLIAAHNALILTLDNLSHLAGDLSDTLCSLSTGIGFATRELYSDADEVLFAAQRPILLNGISELTTRSDLLDRAITLTLPAIPDTRRCEEAVIWQRFEAVCPKVLGALLDGVVAALAHHGSVRLPAKPRMADFAVWVTAAEGALGWPQGSFLKAYTDIRQAAHTSILEESPWVPALEALMAGRARWEGTAGELLGELEARVEEKTRHRRDWPTSPRKLGGELRRLAPDLRRGLGLEVRFERTTEKNPRRLIILERGESLPSELSARRDSRGGDSDGIGRFRTVVCSLPSERKS